VINRLSKNNAKANAELSNECPHGISERGGARLLPRLPPLHPSLLIILYKCEQLITH